MMSFRQYRLKFFSYLTLILLQGAILNSASGQTPISSTTWTGSPASAGGPSAFTTLPATITPGAATVAVSQWNRGSVTFNAAGGCYNSKDWEVGGTLASAQASNKFIFFTITNSATTELRVTQLLIQSQVSATGPQKVQMMYTLGSVTAPFGPTFSTIHTASPESWTMNDDICIGPGQTATFRLYGWGGTGTAGTLRINDNTSVTASFAPAITGTASSNSPICAGTDLYLSGTASGGIPGYTYSWAGPDGFTSGILTPTLTAAPTTAAGVYTLTITDALNCVTTAIPVTTTVAVNTSPSPITGTLHVCPMLTTTLSSISAGGTWSSNDVAIATVAPATGVVTGVATGITTITYQLSSSCFATATLTVDAPPNAITGSMSLCTGLTTTLSSTTGGGSWASSNAAVASISAGGIVTGNSTGTATISYSIPGGCFTTTTVTVYPFPAAIAGTPTVCIGATTSLTNTSGGGTWSSSDATIASVVMASGVVSGVTAGTTNITYMLGGGCSVTRTVTVHPLPGVISGPPVVCVGSSTGLSNADPGGTWSSSNTAVGTINATTGVLTGVSGGTATITYTLPTSCYSTATITVNPIPAAITGPSGVCLGTTVTVNNATASGQWQSSDPSVATVGLSTGVVTGIATGTTRISYVITATGCFVTRTQTVHPLPSTITGPNVVCPGLSITLGSSPAGGNWSSSNIARATAAAGTGVITGVSAGTVTITYTLPIGCTTTKALTVNPAPPASISAIGDTVFCPGDFVVLAGNTGTSLTYQWLKGGVPVPGAGTATYIATTTGLYTIRVTNSFGCPTVSPPVSVLVNSLSATITVPGGTTTACAASPLVLNANPSGAGYSWQWFHEGTPIPGAAGSSYAAGMTGNYTVLITNITGCSDESVATTVTILPSPDAAVTASGPSSFCAGGSVSLTAASGSGYIYQWYNGATLIAGATNATYLATTSGNYSANITNSYGCNVNSNVTNVIVNPLPNPAITPTGALVRCAGSSVPLNAITGGSYTYQWYRNSVAIPGANASVWPAIVSGGYRVRVTNTTTGCTATTGADTIVTIVASPEILPLTPTTFCWGGSTLLSTNVSGAGAGLNYQWYFNGATITSGTGPTYNAGASGNYSCLVSVPGSCAVLTADVAVSEKPLPNPVITSSGSMLRTGAFYTSWQWYKNLLPISGATSYQTAFTGGGSYKVRVTDTNGCQSVSDVYTISGGTTGIAGTMTKGEIRVYPNPAQETLFIDGADDLTVVLRSIDGRELIRTINNKNIDVRNLANGMYILSVYNSENQLIKTEKVIKQ